jgi:hypothetical protein
MAAIRLVTLTFGLFFTTGSALSWNCRIAFTPSWSSAQRGIQKIFFYPSGQNADHAPMVTVDILRFARVVRFLMKPFDNRHLFGFFADLDTISGKQQTPIDMNQWATG